MCALCGYTQSLKKKCQLCAHTHTARHAVSCCAASLLWVAGLLPDPPASAASYEVAFGVHLPPLGYATYALLAAHNTSTATTTSSSSTPLDVASAASAQPAAAKAESASAAAEQPLVYSNGVLSLALHAVTGRLLTVSADDGSWSMQLSQELMWYRSSNGDEQGGTGADADGTTAAAGKAGAGKRAARGGGNGGQSSGAYIFRPAGGTPVSFGVCVWSAAVG